MRIIILCLSPARGGLELYALDEFRQLTERGHDCLFIAARDSYLHSVLEKEKLPFILLNPRLFRIPLWSAYKLSKLTESFNPDILHFHWGKDLYIAAVYKSMQKKPVKLVHSRHMNYTRSKKDIFHCWFYKKIDLLLTGTDLLKELAIQFLPLEQNKIKRLYLGTSEPNISEDACTHIFNSQFPKRQLNLAIYGRIEEGKGQHLVIDAVSCLLKDNYDISLTMIGHAMDKQYKSLQEFKISRSKLHHNIRFVDFMENASESMCCFDIVVLSTHCETFGLVLIEAMRSGVAVIGTDAGGVPEIIQDGKSGLLVEARNSTSMCNAIKKLYNDEPYRIKLASEGKKRADEMFSTDLHYTQLQNVLNESFNS